MSAAFIKDSKEAENYRLRQNAMNERMNALLEAEDKGRLKGKLEIAKELLEDGMDIKKIAKITKLPEKEIINLK